MNPELSLPKGDEEAKCGKPAGALIPRMGMYFSCVLEKGHDGDCSRGGTCFKHGDYTGEYCPRWPECIDAISKPEDEVTLPALSESAVAHMQGEDHNYVTAYRDRSHQLLETLRKLFTTERELSSANSELRMVDEAIAREKFAEMKERAEQAERELEGMKAERDALKSELLLHVNRNIVVQGGEWASDAWERGQLSMRSRINTMMQAHGLGLIGIELLPYTPPLKAAKETEQSK